MAPISLSWYSLLKPFQQGLAPLPVFAETAKRAGYDGIEVLDAFFYPPGTVRDRLPTDSELSVFEEYLASPILPITAIAVTNNFSFPDPARRTLELQKIVLGCKLAVSAGTKLVRVFAGDVTSEMNESDMRHAVVDGLSQATEIAESYGVMLALENHGQIFNRPIQLRDVVEEVRTKTNSKVLGVNVDFGNFALAGVNPIEAARILLDLTAMTHWKDWRLDENGPYVRPDGTKLTGSALGSGIMDLPACFAVHAGRLPMTAELETVQGDDIETSAETLRQLRHAFCA